MKKLQLSFIALALLSTAQWSLLPTTAEANGNAVPSKLRRLDDGNSWNRLFLACLGQNDKSRYRNFPNEYFCADRANDQVNYFDASTCGNEPVVWYVTQEAYIERYCKQVGGRECADLAMQYKFSERPYRVREMRTVGQCKTRRRVR